MTRRIILILVNVLLGISFLTAGEISVSSKLISGKEWRSHRLTPTYTFGMNAQDPGLNPNQRSSYYTNYMVIPGTVKAYITLQIDLRALDDKMMWNRFDVRVIVKDTTYDANLAMVIRTDTLFVDYNPAGQSKFKDVCEIGFESYLPLIKSGFKVSDVIMHKYVNGVAVLLPDSALTYNRNNYTAWYIRTRIEAERYKVIGINSIPEPSHYYDEATNELTISWSDEQAEEYDLEYQYIDNYDVPLSSLRYNFRENCTRIRTKGFSYTMPVLFEKGFLVYRLRSVTRNPLDSVNGYIQKFYSDWSMPYFGNVSTADKFEILKGHYSSLNWQCITTFAEDGKKSEVITYMDGTMRKRQQVSRRNTVPVSEGTTETGTIDGRVNVSEFLYDDMGRQAIEFLPTPVQTNTISFYGKLNLNDNGEVYSKDDFDVVSSGGCRVPPSLPAIDTTSELLSGATVYYSQGNWDSQDFNRVVIPDAGRTPFSQTCFTNDNTGRIRSKTMPGEAFLKGGDHETRYYYGTPSQEELDRLFGNDVGFADHYKKNMVVDANGQTSISYLDLKGNTIATALSGNIPQNLSKVYSSGPFNKPLQDHLLRFNRIDSLNYALVSSKILLVPFDQRYLFDYEVIPALHLDTTCTEQEVCYDCVYDLIVKITPDDCVDSIIFLDSLTIGSPFAQSGQISNTCLDPNPAVSLASLGYIDLKTGSYAITKTLKVNQSGMESYLTDYLKDNCDIWQTILQEELSKIDSTDCEIVCDGCASLVDSINSGYPTTQVMQSLMECLNTQSCDTGINMCESIMESLITDMIPGGQYAEFTYDPESHEFESDFPLSILNTVNTNFLEDKQVSTSCVITSNDYKHPCIQYTDENGDPEYLINQSGEPITPNEASLEDYILNFKKSWEKDIVKLHPEYCYTDWCKLPAVDQSYDLNVSMSHINTYQTAEAAGYLDYPVGDIPANQARKLYAAFVFSFAEPMVWVNYEVELPLNDTNFFCNGNYELSKYKFINRYLRRAAVAIVHCKSWVSQSAILNYVDNHAFGSDPSTRDEEWITYRSLYFSMKEMVLYHWRTQYAVLNNCYNGCIGKQNFDPDFLHFGSSVFYTDAQPCYSGTDSYYANKIRRFADRSNIPGVDTFNLYYDSIPPENSSLTHWTAFNAINHNIRSKIDTLCTTCNTRLFPQSLISENQWKEFLRLILITKKATNFCSTTPTWDTLIMSNQTQWFSLIRDRYEDTVQIVNSSGSIATCNMPYLVNYSAENPLCRLCDTGACTTCCIDQLFLPDSSHRFNSAFTPKVKIVPAKIATIDTIRRIGMDQAYIFDYFASSTDIRRTSPYNYFFYHVSATYRDTINSVPISFQIKFNLVASASPECHLPKCTTCNDTIIRVCPQNDNDVIATGDIKNLFHEWFVSTKYMVLGSYNTVPNRYHLVDNYPSSIVNNYQNYYVPAYASSLFTAEIGLANPELESPFWSLNQCSKFRVSRSDRYQWLDIAQIITCREVAPSELSIRPYNPCDTADEGPWSFYRLDIKLTNNTYDYMEVWRRMACNCTYDTLHCHKTIFYAYGWDQDSLHPDIDTIVSISCNPCQPDTSTWKIPIFNNCGNDLRKTAEHNAQVRYQFYLDSLENAFRQAYLHNCLKATETFDVTYQDNINHYTLYYYDQANNLVMTVPPDGIDETLFDGSATAEATLTEIDNYRRNVPSAVAWYPSHQKTSRYVYNSFNQIVRQISPDAGEQLFVYDQFRRLIASKSARQDDSFTYTIYDDLNRIIETGEATPETPFKLSAYYDYTDFLNLVLNSTTVKTQITHTYYDTPVLGVNSFFGTSGQQNLRGRVASSYYQSVSAGTVFTPTENRYEWASHYSYDMHGNVKSLIHEAPMLNQTGQTYNTLKRLDYFYDLVGGKVNKLIYQKGKWDQFIHKYYYDEDLRLSEVRTSADGGIWDVDASYFYHNYGPLARMEYGSERVQGLDYAYTLQGWLKAMNTGVLDPKRDIGRDGNEDLLSPNRRIARDVFGYVIGYYKHDYLPVSEQNGRDRLAFDPLNYATLLGNELYNGNIAQIWSALSFENPTTNTSLMRDSTLLYTYHYDQLQRLVSQEAYDYRIDRNGWQQIDLMADYQNTFGYDPVGNILALTRMGDRNNSNGIEMDDLYYSYETGTNRLTRIEDPVDPANYPSDLDSQGENNYQYDATGNLISDQSEGIANIEWNIANKIAYIDRGSEPALQFFYDPTGNRVAKTCDTALTVYVRDPQGNVLATYYKKTYQTHENDDTAVFLENVYLYGSARLGEYRPMKKYAPPAQRYYRTKGQRHYEITNHLGNVMATISDRKLGQSPDNDTLINYYHADLLSAQDYYPGGMLMPGRSYSSDSYRFGFNGQEKTNEISGSGNHYSAQFWEMDPRIGRRWERDPVVKHHESPYAILGNNPIWFVDLNGADSSLYNSGTGAFIAKGVTPQDDKTAIWTVDPTAKGYDKDNPWKTAQKLTYSVGKDQKKEVGKNNLRRNHPLAGKGWTYGGQVFEEDLLDMTRDFTGIVNQWMPYFTRNGKEWDKAAQDCLDSWLCALNPNGYTDFLLGKKVAFVGMVGPNMPFDLKSRSRGNLQQIPSYAAIVIGQYSLYRGRLMGYDDYGNAAFGAWGRAYGFGISTLTQGADIDQIFHSGSSDPDRDQYFIKFGFNLLK